MSHELEIINGRASFAYNDRQDPWHRLGTPMKGYQTMEAMLSAAQADYDVLLTPVICCDAAGQPLKNRDGSFVYLPDNKATVRQRFELDEDGVFPVYDGFVAVGNRYVVAQNKELLERAFAILEVSDDAAILDTVGVLYGGKQMFACIDLGEVVITIDGIPDPCKRYMLIYSGHDGKLAFKLVLTGVRAVCKNTVQMGLSKAAAKFSARHTQGGLGYSVKEAQAALGLSSTWADEYKKLANELLLVSTDGNAFDKAFKTVFPLENDATDRQKVANDEVRTLVSGIWANDNNAGTYGKNGWTLWNAFTEYLDHYREGDADARALTTLNEDSWVGKRKVIAKNAVLALV